MSKRRPLLFATPTAALSIFALTGGPAASAAAQIPPQLAGQWAIPWQGGTEYLTLADSRFMFFFNHPGQEPPMGDVSVTGTTITFYSSQTCTGTGTYQWSLSNGALTFTQAAGSSDPCPRQAVLTSGTWTRH
jgi:hypothetical protein